MLRRTTTNPDPYEPFLLSQGIRLGDYVLSSGQARYDVHGRIDQGGFRVQGEPGLRQSEPLAKNWRLQSGLVKVTIEVETLCARGDDRHRGNHSTGMTATVT